MPAQQTPHRQRRRPEPRQFDLFDAARRVAPEEPDWKALPEAARREVMTALTRLMLDQGGGLQGREARHDH
jgi:DNA-directed RNA polymerase specialized sigma24 family protein